MKTATLPALRVSRQLREAAERALRPDETLSNLVEASLKKFLELRQSQDDFIARGLRASAESTRTGIYLSPDEVMAKLRALSAAKRANKASLAGAR